MTTAKGERRRQALAEAAAELLAEGGFDAVRHRAVAERADLPLASTTYYFDSLDDLVLAALEHGAATELAAARDRLESTPTRRRGTEAAVELVLDLLVGPTGEGSRETVVARYERFVASARRPAVGALQRRMRSQLDEVLTEILVRCGREVTPDRLGQLVAIVDGAVVGSLIESGPDPREDARTMLLAVLDLLAPLARV
ncbi:TetR family transcriptional regulator [Rhodococcus aerolatus]